MNEKHFERGSERIVLRPASENNMGYNNRPELEVNTVLLEEPAKPGLIKRGFGYAKENPVKTTLMVAGGCAAGYGLYKAGKWTVNKVKGLFSKNEEDEAIDEVEVEIVEEKKDNKKEKK